MREGLIEAVAAAYCVALNGKSLDTAGIRT
jgi:hypothetical protein